MKKVLVLGGPNGAGKTSSAQGIIVRKLGITEFVNADEIARGVSPYDPAGAAVTAGRLMLERLRVLSKGSKSFAFETTCAGKTHFGFLRTCKQDGWDMALVFLWLPSPADAIARVARRIASGGHAIEPGVITRRYWRGLQNMHSHYLPMADEAAIYDNLSSDPILVAEKMPGSGLFVRDGVRWEAIRKGALCVR